MVAACTADQLVTRITVRAQIPSTEGRVSTAELLTLIDDCILANCSREIFDADDGRWVKTASDVSITAAIATYRIPDRALAAGVVECVLVDSAGNLTQLDYFDHADLWEYGTSAGVPQGFTLLGDVIVLRPIPSTSTYSLRVRYVRRPSKLALVASCTLLTAVGSTTLTGTIGSGWSSPTTIDVVESTNNVESLEDDIAVTYSGTTITRSSGTNVTTGAYAIAAGDYACLAGTSCVVQVPDVAIPYLADLAARDVLSGPLDDAAGAARCHAQAEERRREMMQALAERSRSARPKVVPRNSPLRVASAGYRRWWRS